MLSLAELQRAEQILSDQVLRLRVPEPSNSISNQLQNGTASNRTGDTNVQPVARALQPRRPRSLRPLVNLDRKRLVAILVPIEGKPRSRSDTLSLKRSR